MRRLLAEWETQSAVIIAWPSAAEDFSELLEAVEGVYRLLTKAILPRQSLCIVCKNATHQQHIQTFVPTGCRFIHSQYNDIWLRDSCPLCVQSVHGFQLLNFQFNGWGEKYPHAADNTLARKLLQANLFGPLPMRDIAMILEGGSIDSDGRGTLLTTRQCLLNANRNPQFSKVRISNLLKQYLGATRILWLDQEQLTGDDTDAHIDTLARFCSTGCIAYSSCDDPHDPQFRGLKNMQAQLQSFTTHAGQRYRLIPLPLPSPVFAKDKQRLPANYANFLIINTAVLVPVYDDAMDAIALQRLAHCFPERDIIAIPCLPLIQQYGSLHCMSMQYPASVIG